MIGNVPQPWESMARCREYDPALFFGPNGFEPKRERLAREAAAKEICQGCPALGQCRAYALANGEAYGVWGGMGEAERRSIVARRERTRRAG